MQATSLPHCFWTLDDLSPDQARRLLALARALKRSGARSGRPLAGRHVAVLCDAAHSLSADVFAGAAAGLGAVVVRIRDSLCRLAQQADLPDTARTLGRLYGAIEECDECQPPAALQQLSDWAGVPVFGAVAAPTHPSRLLADLLTMDEHAGRPLAQTTLWLAGAPRSPLAAAWRRLGDFSGVEVRDGGAAAAPTTAGAFVCQGGADAPPALLALDPRTGEGHALWRAQVENHRYVVQAMLCGTVD